MEVFDKQLTKKFSSWVVSHQFRLTLFNLILVLLFLLRSAGYFHPYFVISVNMIVFVGFVLSIFILNTGSTGLFAVAAFFWIFAGFLKIMGIDVWAERTSVYTYQVLVLASVLFFVENVGFKKK